MEYVVLAIPVFFLLIGLELLITRIQEKDYYSLSDSISDLGCGLLAQLFEAGMKTADLCREHNISAATFYAWKAKYGGLEVSEAQELKRLREENSKLKRVVADLTLDNVVLKDLLSKNW